MEPVQATNAAPVVAISIGARARSGRLAGLGLATLTASLGASLMNVVLPSLAMTFAASFASVQWLVIAYLVASTALIVVVGRLGDVVGPRRLLLVGIAVFAVASFACAFAPTLPWLIAGRALQGLGAAVMLALTVALARAVVDERHTGAAMGLLGTMSAIGTALGPSLGGVLATSFGWRAVFFATVPLAVVAWLLTAQQVPHDRARPRGAERFEPAGAVLLALTLGTFALALTPGLPFAWRLGGGSVVAVGGAAFVAFDRRATAPLVPLSVMRAHGIGGALLANTVVAAVMMTTLVVGPFHLGRALGLAPGAAGLVMSVGPTVAALVGVPAGRLVDRLGAHRMARAGLLGMAIGVAALAAGSGVASVLAYVVPLALTTASYAWFSAANNTAVMVAANAGQRGVLAGLLSATRNLGLMTGATVASAGFAAACGGTDATAASAERIASATGSTFAVAALVVAGALGLTWQLSRVSANGTPPRPAAPDVAHRLP